MYPVLHIFQSHPVGQTGLFAKPILAPGPYIWHPCLRRSKYAVAAEVQEEIFFSFFSLRMEN